MKLEMSGQMRIEQQMRLAPHMIQSMEILQLPILALQERIEQELNSNPVLEVEEPENPEPAEEESAPAETGVAADNRKAEDFERIKTLDDDYKEYMEESGTFKVYISDGPDKKLEAIKNTAAAPQSLHEYLDEQWHLIDAPEPVKKAGSAIIDYIDDRGYLCARLEQLQSKDRTDFALGDLKKALELIQNLDPPGIGARDIKECLLIQLTQSPDDTTFEQKLVANYMDALLENRLPEIARKMNTTVEKIKRSVVRLSKLDTSPGLQVGRDENYPITADLIVEPDDADGCTVRLADTDLPRLRINDYYLKMVKDSHAAEEAKKFLQENVRSAQWIIDAIEQRKNTLLKVAKAVVKYQKDFFDKGQLFLHPLPMSKVADDIGVHLATVSRAVAGKYIQCSWGVLPLRKFFSGGTEDQAGDALSWEAVRGKLQQIINAEDKTGPLSDDMICSKLAELGITNIARRTVAKYRKLLSIPTARFRKKY